MSDVTDLLDRLTAGQTTLDDVVRDFESRAWPPAPDDKARRAAALSGADPEPMAEGSFNEVASAFINGQIDREQYAALAEAAAKGMGGGDTSGDDSGGDSGDNPDDGGGDQAVAEAGTADGSTTAPPANASPQGKPVASHR